MIAEGKWIPTSLHTPISLGRPFSLSLFLSLSRSYVLLPCRVQGNIGTSLYQSMSHSPRFPSSWFLLHRSYTRARRNDIICYFVPRDFPRIFDIKVPSGTYEFCFHSLSGNIFSYTGWRILFDNERKNMQSRMRDTRICGN